MGSPNNMLLYIPIVHYCVASPRYWLWGTPQLQECRKCHFHSRLSFSAGELLPTYLLHTLAFIFYGTLQMVNGICYDLSQQIRHRVKMYCKWHNRCTLLCITVTVHRTVWLYQITIHLMHVSASLTVAPNSVEYVPPAAEVSFSGVGWQAIDRWSRLYIAAVFGYTYVRATPCWWFSATVSTYRYLYSL